jgi:hypothetical protein
MAEYVRRTKFTLSRFLKASFVFFIEGNKPVHKQTLDRLRVLHILPDFLSLLHLTFHLFPRQVYVLNYIFG